MGCHASGWAVPPLHPAMHLACAQRPMQPRLLIGPGSRPCPMSPWRVGSGWGGDSSPRLTAWVWSLLGSPVISPAHAGEKGWRGRVRARRYDFTGEGRSSL